MDLDSVAVDLLDRLPANRTLGLRITEVGDGIARAELPVSEPVTNVIRALHSSGVVALADAAGLAAALSVSPDEATARRLQPLGVEVRVTFHRPVRGIAVATCILDAISRAALARLFSGAEERARLTTLTTIDGDRALGAAEGEFDWVVRLGPG